MGAGKNPHIISSITVFELLLEIKYLCPVIKRHNALYCGHNSREI